MRLIAAMMLVLVSGWANECKPDDQNRTIECIQKNSASLHEKTDTLKKNHTNIRDDLSKLKEELKNTEKDYDGFSKKIESIESNETVRIKINDDKATLQQLSFSVNNMLSDGSPDLFDTSLILGVQLQPSYNNSNENEGFNHSTLYAKLNIDYRADEKCKCADNWFCNAGYILPSNYGMDLEYLGTPVEHNVTDPASATSTPTSFNDVSNTFQTTVYASCNIYRFTTGSELGLLAQGGLMTRDKKDQYENTINKYYGFGAEYVYSDLLLPNYKPDNKSYNKRYPKAKISLVRRKYDYFAGEEDTWRTILDFEYKIGVLMLGFNANTGEKQDTMYLKFGLVKSYGEIVDFFTTK